MLDQHQTSTQTRIVCISVYWNVNSLINKKGKQEAFF